jgi:hypothetical protein
VQIIVSVQLQVDVQLQCDLYRRLWLQLNVLLMMGDDVVVVVDQGPEPRLRFALQPLGLLYTLFYRNSHRRSQMSPRPTRRERSKQREVEL